MSSAPIRSEQTSGTQPSHLQSVSEELDPRKPFSVVSAATGAAATVATRALGFGFVGFVLGTVLFFIEWGTGLLAYPAEPVWSKAVFLLLPIYMAAGAFGLGAAGMWRGIGRAMMNLVKEHKLAQHISNRVLDRVAALAAGVPKPDILRKPLPIQALRHMLKQAINAYASSDDTEKGVRGMSRAILRRVKSGVCRHVETRLNEIIGEETRDQGVVELTIHRLRELAESRLEARVLETLNGARNKQALLFGSLFLGAVAVAPIVITLLR